MEELLRAIGIQWDSDAGAPVRELAPGGLYFVQAPQGVLDSGKTYVVYSPLPGSVTDTNTSKIEEPVISFAIYQSEENEQVKTIWAVRDALIACYDDKLLIMLDDANGNPRRMIAARRLYSGDAMKEDKGWSCHIDYRFNYTIEP